ncbi:MAG: chloride channel protein [Steroidobacteraceae bacterium]
MRDVVSKTGNTLLSSQRWQARLLLWTAAIAVGAAAVGFAWLADMAHELLRRLIDIWPYWPLLLAPCGFLLIAWLTRRFFRGAEGSGIPQTIYALQPDSDEQTSRLMKPRVVLGRMGLACAGLFCGASVGREGPTVHVGAAISHQLARWFPHGDASAQQRMLILAGGAAGVAAAFNTPLAGIVFAIEELSRSFEERASGTTLTAVILAGITAIALAGNYTYFGHPTGVTMTNSVSVAVLGLALASGLAGGLFSRFTLSSAAGLPGTLGNLQRQRPLIFALLCGMGVAMLGWLSGGLTYGTGYVEAKSIMEANTSLPWLYAPARALATLLSYLSGIPAGLLAPSLSVGAGFGQMFAELSHQAIVPFAILGMCGYLAGVTQAPLTSFVIVMEMTSQHQMVLPLMFTAALATTVSKLLSKPLYRTLASRYLDRQ